MQLQVTGKFNYGTNSQSSCLNRFLFLNYKIKAQISADEKVTAVWHPWRAVIYFKQSWLAGCGGDSAATEEVRGGQEGQGVQAPILCFNRVGVLLTHLHSRGFQSLKMVWQPVLQTESTAVSRILKGLRNYWKRQQHHTCNILPKVRAPVVSHDLNGIQVILGDVVINDKVNAGNDQLIHHINTLCYRVLIICFKERSRFGIQLLQIKNRVEKKKKKSEREDKYLFWKSLNKYFPNFTVHWNCLGIFKNYWCPNPSKLTDWYLGDLGTGVFFFNAPKVIRMQQSLRPSGLNLQVKVIFNTRFYQKAHSMVLNLHWTSKSPAEGKLVPRPLPRRLV